MKRQYVFFSALALLFLCLIAVYVYYPTDENRIRGIIKKCERAVISEDIDKLMGFISYNYRDDYGNGYLRLKKTFQTAFKKLNDIDIKRNIIKISVDDTLAEAELLIRVLASRGEDMGYIIGDAGKAGKIKVFFEKSPRKWLIIKVEGVFQK